MPERRLRIATGTDNFEKLVTTSDVYIDKTLFIEEIINSGKDAILITRPRRWGKSLALDMLKFFLQISSDEEIRASKEIFSKLKIKDGTTYDDKKKEEVNILEHSQGKFPVIHISFKDVTGDTYEEVELKVIERIKTVFTQYNYLRGSANLSADEKSELAEYLRGVFDKSKLEKSLEFLSSLLYSHHGKRVYILVDEYDKPVNFFLEKSLTDNIEARNKVVLLMTSIMSNCGKTSRYLEKIVITGILDAFYRSANSGFNNVEVFDIKNSVFGGSFGFSEDEVRSLVDIVVNSRVSIGLEEPRTSLMPYIERWYNGYNIQIARGGTEHSSKAYTPWSVMRYLSNYYSTGSMVPKNYWAASGLSDVLDNLSRQELPQGLLDDLKSLSEGASVALVVPQETFSLVKSIRGPNELAQNLKRIVTYILFNSGYLTMVEDKCYKLPNQEVREYFREQVLSAWISQEFGVKPEEIVNVAERISNSIGDIKTFKSTMRDLMEGLRGSRNEATLHAMIGGPVEMHSIANGRSRGYYALSEVYTGEGRLDNVFYPVIPHGGGSGADYSMILHEYKMLDKTEEGGIGKILNDAMLQILENKYLSKPLSEKSTHPHHRWTSIKIRSIVFVRDASVAGGEWSLEAIEQYLTLDGAQRVVDFFSDNIVRQELKRAHKAKHKYEFFCSFFKERLKIAEDLENIEEFIKHLVRDDALKSFKEAVLVFRGDQIRSILKDKSEKSVDEVLREFLISDEIPKFSAFSDQIKDAFDQEAEEFDRVVRELFSDSALARRPRAVEPNAKKSTLKKGGGSGALGKAVGDVFAEYYKDGLDTILPLRLAIALDVRVYKAIVVSDETREGLSLTAPIDALTLGLDNHFLGSSNRVVVPILYDQGTDKSYHWVGAIISWQDDSALTVTYMDPENNPVPQALVQALSAYLPSGVYISFQQRFVQVQSYSNNCGPELIEHFAEALTGSRVTEDLVSYAHSELVVRALYAEANYITRPVALIKAQGSTASDVLILGTNLGESDSATYFFIDTISAFANRWLGAQLKHFVHRKELAQLKSILFKYEIKEPIGEVLSDKGFRKVTLKLHPDRGGNAKDFVFARNLKDTWQQDLDVKPLIDAGMQRAQPILYKATIGFKALDIAVDVVRFYQEPQVGDAKKLMVSSMHLYSMCSGSYLSIFPAAMSVIDTYMKLGAVDALSEATTHAAYIVLPSVLIASNPYMGFAYTAAITGISAYNAISNAYDLYQTSYWVEQDSSIPLENIESGEMEQQPVLSGDVLVNI